MTDEVRIDMVLDLIGRYWRRHPTLRLCQLIGNMFGAGDHYHVEDETLMKCIVASNLKEGI